MGHARRHLQPSSFFRTMNCPGWASFSKDVPRDTNVYAAEGSVAHYLAERALATNFNLDAFVGLVGWYNNGRTGVASSDIAEPADKGQHFVFKITEEMVAAVRVYVDLCRSLAAQSVGAKVLVEKKLSLDPTVPGMFGTGDYVIIEPLNKITVLDYKHGAGVKVVAEDNVQTKLYGAMALGDNPYAVDLVECYIVQPRCPSSQTTTSATYGADELQAWVREVIAPAAKNAEAPGAPLEAGDWCRFCPGATINCPALRASSLERARIMFDTAVVPDPATFSPVSPAGLTGEQFDRVLRAAGMIKVWLASVEEEAYRRLELGQDPPMGWKLVAGRMSNRAWADEELTASALEDLLPHEKVFVEKIASPAQIERELKKIKADHAAILQPLLAERAPGRPVMVPIEDPRQPLPPKIEQMFGEQEI